MEQNNSLPIQNCISADTANFVITITVLTLPFHFLMIKVLIRDLRLNLPRHNIMLCLTVSDALQIFLIFSSTTTMHILKATKDSAECDISGSIRYFILAMTLIVSSLSIIALSVERYVACIHSFHLHQIFTKGRMARGISCIWIIGLIGGTATVALAATNLKVMGLRYDYGLKIITVMFISPTSILISIIQYRLLAFSRKKLARVIPGTTFGAEAEMSDFRRKEIKVAFVASIVAIAYISCMFPMACLSLYELIYGNISSASLKAVFMKLMFFNNFADPFIYGIGVVDARKAIVRNLKKIRNFIIRLCRS